MYISSRPFSIHLYRGYKMYFFRNGAKEHGQWDFPLHLVDDEKSSEATGKVAPPLPEMNEISRETKPPLPPCSPSPPLPLPDLPPVSPPPISPLQSPSPPLPSTRRPYAIENISNSPLSEPNNNASSTVHETTGASSVVAISSAIPSNYQLEAELQSFYAETNVETHDKSPEEENIPKASSSSTTPLRTVKKKKKVRLNRSFVNFHSFYEQFSRPKFIQIF